MNQQTYESWAARRRRVAGGESLDELQRAAYAPGAATWMMKSAWTAIWR